jgi:hypothetical protein
MKSQPAKKGPKDQQESKKTSGNSTHGLAIRLESYMALNRFSDGEAVAEKMHLLAPDVPHYSIYFLGFVRGDANEMQRQMTLVRARKGDIELLASAAADTNAYYGHIERQPSTQMTSIDNEAVAISQTKRALWEAEFQLTDAAQGCAKGVGKCTNSLCASSAIAGTGACGGQCKGGEAHHRIREWHFLQTP